MNPKSNCLLVVLLLLVTGCTDSLGVHLASSAGSDPDEAQGGYFPSPPPVAPILRVDPPTSVTYEAPPRLADVPVVGETLGTVMTFDEDSGGTTDFDCATGEPCQVGALLLRDDGSYIWRAEVGPDANRRVYTCDLGLWEEGPGELRLMSCGGSVYVADWAWGAPEAPMLQETLAATLKIGAYEFGATDEFRSPDDPSLRCDFECVPFFDQRF